MRRYVLLSLMVGIASCASHAGTETPAGESAPVRRGNVISEPEIEQTNAGTVLELIQRLRPSFLIERGSASMTQRDPGIVVYVDGTMFGDVSSLGRMQARDVKRIEYLSATEATQRFGTGHVHGAILVTRQ
jgi:hypothetical protein